MVPTTSTVNEQKCWTGISMKPVQLETPLHALEMKKAIFPVNANTAEEPDKKVDKHNVLTTLY